MPMPVAFHHSRHPEADVSWRSRGACRGIDPELFFPVDEKDSGPAKAVCARCPVLEACREYGMGERDGVWGGLTERERRRIRKRRRANG